MSAREEWGAWIEHDGSGVPVPLGSFVHVVGSYAYSGKIARAGVPVGRYGFVRNVRGSWFWSGEGPNPQNGFGDVGRIIRYRIRRPRALTELVELVENLPAPSKPTEVPA